MRAIIWSLAVLLGAGAVPSAARAGWTIDWQHTAFKSDGTRLKSETSTTRISRGRARLAQSSTVAVMDYHQQHFTVLNPRARTYWRGPVKEYVAQVARNRDDMLRKKAGSSVKLDLTPPGVDEAHLPPITVEKTAETKTIAGYETVKYTVTSNGTLFQELWVTDRLNLSADLNPSEVLAYEREMSASWLGKSAALFAALYRSKAYRQLHETHVILETIVHHQVGGYERIATAIQQAEVADEEFAVPADYRAVSLSDVFAAGEESPNAERR